LVTKIFPYGPLWFLLLLIVLFAVMSVRERNREAE
jgi:hypothetical protein